MGIQKTVHLGFVRILQTFCRSFFRVSVNWSETKTKSKIMFLLLFKKKGFISQRDWTYTWIPSLTLWPLWPFCVLLLPQSLEMFSSYNFPTLYALILITYCSRNQIGAFYLLEFLHDSTTIQRIGWLKATNDTNDQD